MTLSYVKKRKKRQNTSTNDKQRKKTAELNGPGKLLRIRPNIVDVGPKSAPKPDEAKPGAVPTNRHKPIPIDFGPVSGCFDHDPKLVNCEIAQPTFCYVFCVFLRQTMFKNIKQNDNKIMFLLWESLVPGVPRTLGLPPAPGEARGTPKSGVCLLLFCICLHFV